MPHLARRQASRRRRTGRRCFAPPDFGFLGAAFGFVPLDFGFAGFARPGAAFPRGRFGGGVRRRAAIDRRLADA